MLFKVKEHFRKTKSGKLTRVKESNRSRVKKGLIVAGTALTTLGLGALAYKKLGSKLVKGAVSVSSKADDVAASKAKDITTLLTPKKLTTSAKSYQTLPDPWLEGSTRVNKAKKVLTTGKKETKLLTGSRYKAENIPDPWDDAVIKGTDKQLTVSKLKEKPLMIPGKGQTSGATRKSEYTIRTSKPETNILQTDVRVSKKWSTTNPRSTGKVWQSTRSGRNNYAIDQKLNSRLNKGEKASSLIDKSKKKYNTENLVTRVKARNTAIQNQKVFASSLMDVVTDRPQSRSRRELLKTLTGSKAIRQLQTTNPTQMLMEAGKDSAAIQKAGQETADKINAVLSRSMGRRGAIQAGAEGAKGAVKGRIKRKLKGKLIGRLTKSLKSKELNPKNQSSAINQYRKLKQQFEGVPTTSRRKLLQAAEDLVVPGGSEAKKKKALQIYQRTLKELDNMRKDTGVGAAEDFVKSKTKNKKLRKAGSAVARLKKILTGEV